MLVYWEWTTSTAQQTKVVFTVGEDDVFSCSADGGGNIINNDVMLAPAFCANETYAIIRRIDVMPTINSDTMNLSIDLWLDINNIATGLSNSQNFRYALTMLSDCCTYLTVASGNFSGKTIR